MWSKVQLAYFSYAFYFSIQCFLHIDANNYMIHADKRAVCICYAANYSLIHVWFIMVIKCMNVFYYLAQLKCLARVKIITLKCDLDSTNVCLHPAQWRRPMTMTNLTPIMAILFVSSCACAVWTTTLTRTCVAWPWFTQMGRFSGRPLCVFAPRAKSTWRTSHLTTRSAAWRWDHGLTTVTRRVGTVFLRLSLT